MEWEKLGEMFAKFCYHGYYKDKKKTPPLNLWRTYEV